MRQVTGPFAQGVPGDRGDFAVRVQNPGYPVDGDIGVGGVVAGQFATLP